MREETRARAALIALLLASVVLVALDLREGGAIGGVRGFVAAVVGPVERAAGALAAPLVSASRTVLSFGSAAEREESLNASLRQLAEAPGSVTLGEVERRQVDELLASAGLAGYRVVPARVVAYSSFQRFSSAVTLDVGSSSGLSTDMAVITGQGLAGKVVSIGPNTATVQLISDPSMVMGVRAGEAQQAGSLAGTGSPGEAVLTLLDTTAALREGDLVSTFGSAGGRPYPPGVAVGKVVGFRGEIGEADRVALVKPLVELTSLDIVGVVVEAPAASPRTGVRPPAPTPTASNPTTSNRVTPAPTAAAGGR